MQEFNSLMVKIHRKQFSLMLTFYQIKQQI